MGLRPPRYQFFSAAGLLTFAAFVALPAHAAPMLRLVTSTIGPVQVATAGPTNTQTLEAYNAGDGTLNLSFSSSVQWIAATLGASRNCINTSAAKTCLPIQFAINTTGLAQGVSSGIVTVSDPNAVDSPQTVAVLVRVGSVSVYAAPGASTSVPFAVSSYVAARSTTQSGGNWLSVAAESVGSFLFNYQYQIQFQPPASLASGPYSGSVAISGSGNSTDNQTIPVSMQVTSQPIAVPATATTFKPQPVTTGLTIRLAQGAPPLTYPFSPTILLNNAGQGTLSVQNTAITGSWLKQDPVTAYGVPGFFEIDPTGLAVGDNPGSVAFTSNAANGTVTVPVDLQIVAQGAPQVYFQGVQNNATFLPGDTVAPGDILVVKGEQLTFSAPALNLPIPLPTDAGGTSVLVNGTAVPLYYTSYGQIAFQLPYNVPPGTALIQVKRDDGQISNQASAIVAATAPRLLVTVNQDYSINSAAHPAHAGDVLTVYAIGLGATSPAVDAGAAAPSTEPLAQVSGLIVNFGDGPIGTQEAAPLFAGLTPTFAGLYQVNVYVPSGLDSGAVDLSVSVSGNISNALTLYLQ